MSATCTSGRPAAGVGGCDASSGRGNPDPARRAHNTVAPGQPSLWCGWQPCWDGCCLAHDGIEKFYGATGWLCYLIDHFLAPHAHAQSSSGLGWFTDFTFDHVLDGIVAGCRRDTRELYLIRVEQNVVSEQSRLGPDSELRGAGPLPYELAIDATAARRRRPR